MTTTSARTDSDEMVVNRARRRIARLTQFRWFFLRWAGLFLGVALCCTIMTVRKVDALEHGAERQLLAYGVVLGIVWATLLMIAGLCIGKFLAGCRKDFREAELLVRYHDRLLELGELKPADANTEKNG